MEVELHISPIVHQVGLQPVVVLIKYTLEIFLLVLAIQLKYLNLLQQVMNSQDGPGPKVAVILEILHQKV